MRTLQRQLEQEFDVLQACAEDQIASAGSNIYPQQMSDSCHKAASENMRWDDFKSGPPSHSNLGLVTHSYPSLPSAEESGVPASEAYLRVSNEVSALEERVALLEEGCAGLLASGLEAEIPKGGLVAEAFAMWNSKLRALRQAAEAGHGT